MSRRRRSKTNTPAPAATGDLRTIVREELAELTKALALPSGAQATPMSAAYLATLTRQPLLAGATELLPRDERPVAFGPGVPLAPGAIDPVLGSGRPAPRRAEYPVSWNLQITTRHVPWQTLRDAADQVSIIRKCIEIRKSALAGMEWAFTIDPTRIARLAAASGQTRHEVKAALADQHADTVAALQDWWARPDRINDWVFADWLNALLEDHLVLDAVAVYPHLTMSGKLHSFELLDSATVKPLLDWRGGVPQPPHPAYQQILHGFPRGEFTASAPQQVDAEFISAVYGRPDLTGLARTDALVYKVRNRRTHSPYGLSCTEQALIDADLWLKRQAWLRAEYDDGVTPEVLMKLDAAMSPDQLRAYEKVFNDDLAGRSRERHRAKFLPAGFDPLFPPGMDSKFSPEADLHLIRLICADFDVMPSELGFVPTSGLGGKGHQEGEHDTSERRGTRPTAAWLVDLINDVSRAWLGMPPEVTFRFVGLDNDDEDAVSARTATDVGAGMRTLNEGRDQLNLPRYGFADADEPFVMVAGAPVYLNPEVRKRHAEMFGPPDQPLAGREPRDGGDDERDEQPAGDTPTGSPRAGVDADQERARRAEAKAFLAFAGKRAGTSRWRDFEFEHLDEDEAEAANRLGAAGDLDAARALFAVPTR